MPTGALLVAAVLALSQGESTDIQLQQEAQQEPSPQSAPWEPPLPGAEQFDWIQLNTGEWLKGELVAMQDDVLEFDSEKLDDLSFDWEDVHHVRSSRTLELLLVGFQRVSGPVAITRDDVQVGGLRPRTFPRWQLISITRSRTSALDLWSGKATLGLTARKGNTDEVVYNAKVNLQRRTPSTRYQLDYVGNVSRLEGVENSNNQRVSTDFTFWLSKRLSLVVPFAEYYTDEFQNLDYRLTLSAGPAYYLLNDARTRWSVFAGPAYQATRYDSVQAGESASIEAATAMLRTELEWELTQRIDLDFEYQGQLTTDELGRWLHHAVLGLDVELTDVLELDVSFIWDRTSEPQADSAGNVPEKDDYRLVVGVSVDF